MGTTRTVALRTFFPVALAVALTTTALPASALIIAVHGNNLTGRVDIYRLTGSETATVTDDGLEHIDTWLAPGRVSDIAFRPTNGELYALTNNTSEGVTRLLASGASDTLLGTQSSSVGTGGDINFRNDGLEFAITRGESTDGGRRYTATGSSSGTFGVGPSTYRDIDYDNDGNVLMLLDLIAAPIGNTLDNIISDGTNTVFVDVGGMSKSASLAVSDADGDILVARNNYANEDLLLLNRNGDGSYSASHLVDYGAGRPHDVAWAPASALDPRVAYVYADDGVLAVQTGDSSTPSTVRLLGGEQPETPNLTGGIASAGGDITVFQEVAAIEVTRDLIDFGDVRIGTTSGGATLQVINAGTAFSQLSGEFGTGFGEFSGGGGTFDLLGPQQGSDSEDFFYTPIGHDADDYQVAITSDAGGRFGQLQGRGVGPELRVESNGFELLNDAFLNFGPVIVGESFSITLRIFNDSPDLDLGDLTRLTLNAGGFLDGRLFSVQGLGPGATLAPGEFLDLDLLFSPDVTGFWATSFNLFTDVGAALGGFGQQFSLQVQGVGIEAPTDPSEVPAPPSLPLALLALLGVIGRPRRSGARRG